MLKPYENHVFYEILILDLQREDPEKLLFFQFLDNVEGVSSYFSHDYRQELKKKFGNKSLSDFKTIRSERILSANYKVDKLIGNYIKKLFKKYTSS